MIVRVAFFILMSLGLIGFGTVAWITTRPMGLGGPPPTKMILVAAAADRRRQPADVRRSAAKGNPDHRGDQGIQPRHARTTAAA